jgi:hypothetical protein
LKDLGVRHGRFFMPHLLAPQHDKQHKKVRGREEPRDQDYLNSKSAHGRNIAFNVGIFIEEAMPIAKEIYEGDNVYGQEERSRNPQSWKSYWIDLC